jgi:TRAP transporter TAXI family solute receptor
VKVRKQIVLLVVTAVLLSCVTVVPAGAAVRYVRIGTASMGGVFYPMGNALAQLFTDKLSGVRASSQSTGGSAENCRLLARKELELGLVQSATLKEALAGVGQFKDGPVTGLRAITAIYFMPFHVIARKDANIDSVADLRGKKIGVGPIGSGIEVNALMLLAAHGIGAKDFQAIHQSQQETYEGLKTGSVHAHIYATGAGSAQITDVMLTGKVRLLPIDGGMVKSIMASNPEFGRYRIAAKTYPNQPDMLDTFAGSAVLVARADLDEAVVYEMTKAIFENLPYLSERHAYFEQTNADDATVGIVLDLHPGAERYLKDVGAI